jgi:hypothetical protein
MIKLKEGRRIMPNITIDRIYIDTEYNNEYIEEILINAAELRAQDIRNRQQWCYTLNRKVRYKYNNLINL